MMKIFTTKKANKVHPEFGKILQVTFYIFGFLFWTENHEIEVEPKEEIIKHNYELEEITGFQKWKNEFQHRNLSNAEFDNFQNQQLNKI